MLLRWCTLLTVLICNTFAQDQATSSLIVFPEGKQQKSIGGGVVFSCSALNTKNPRLEWITPRGDKVWQTVTTERVHTKLEENSLTLFISDLSEVDAGNWTCTGSVDGQNRKKSTTLILVQDIVFEKFTAEQHPISGMDQTIWCQVRGSFSPVVNWLRGSDTPGGQSMEIHSDSRYTITAQGLLVHNISSADNGVYRCSAYQISETASNYDHRDIRVEVHIPAVIVAATETIKMTEDWKYMMYCNATGYPPPEYLFYKGTEPNPSNRLFNSADGRFQIESNTGKNYSALVFHRVRVDDNGTYLCEARNSVGKPSHRIMVANVIIPARFDHMWNDSVHEGETQRITCDINRFTTAPMTMRWRYVNGTDRVVEDGANGRLKAWSEPWTHTYPKTRFHLEVTDARPEDFGNWTCDVTNEGGNRSHNATLLVNYEPRFPVEDQITREYGWPGRLLNLSCESVSFPLPSVIWHHNEWPIKKNNDTYKIYYEMYQGADVISMQTRYKMKLLINLGAKWGNEEWVYGDYKCEARNVIGTRMHTVRLIRAERPRPPFITFSNASSTVIWITVSATHFQEEVPITGFRVSWRGDQAMERVQEFPVEPNTFVIHGLIAKSRYQFDISAVNAAGAGPASSHEQATNTAGPPGRVRITSGTLATSTNRYVLTWRLYYDDDGGSTISVYEVTSQTVEVRPDGSLRRMGAVRTIDARGTSSTLILDDLSSGGSYEVRIRAVNQLGTGVWSSTVVTTASGGVTYAPGSYKSKTDSTPDVGRHITALILIAAALL